MRDRVRPKYLRFSTGHNAWQCLLSTSLAALGLYLSYASLFDPGVFKPGSRTAWLVPINESAHGIPFALLGAILFIPLGGLACRAGWRLLAKANAAELSADYLRLHPSYRKPAIPFSRLMGVDVIQIATVLSVPLHALRVRWADPEESSSIAREAMIVSNTIVGGKPSLEVFAEELLAARERAAP